MILTRHFVYIHVPKTGGNFVKRVLTEHSPEEWEIWVSGRRHPSSDEIPGDWRELPRFAFVRNPYAWYVSWYHFQKAKQTTSRDFFDEISEGGTLDFQPTMRNALAAKPDGSVAEGPYTQNLRAMLGNLDRTVIGRVEELRDDLLRILSGLVAVPEDLARQIREHDPVNVSKHGHYSEYYDQDLRDLVALRDRPAFEHFGYTFEDAP